MLIFAKNISERDHVHPDENSNPDLKSYMEYQRKLFPYTIIRAGLDLAYKEIDDILDYVENGHKIPEGSKRDNYPEDIPGWYQFRYPWSSSALQMEEMHDLLVTMVKSMDSFRTHEAPNTYHLAVLYDSTLKIVEVYNNLLKTDFNSARDIRLSTNVEVDFDDFVNNYWPHLEFMIFSKPDFSHTNLLKENQQIESVIQDQLKEGHPPLVALENAAKKQSFAEGTLEYLKKEPLRAEWVEPVSKPMDEGDFDHLNKISGEEGLDKGKRQIDIDYEKNFQLKGS